MPSKLSNRIDPDRSSITATSRGRWTAVAVALILNAELPIIRPKRFWPEAVTVDRTRFGVSWVAVVTTLGFVFGRSVDRIEQGLGLAAAVAAAVVVAGVFVWHRVRPHG